MKSSFPPILIRSLACVLIAGVFASAPQADAQANSYSDIVVFGDSLSDVGNTANNFWVQVFSDTAQPPNWQGRFSNGPVWVETLADDYLGLSASTRSSAGGNNYAQGGALSGNGTNFLGFIDNVGNQVGAYLGANTPDGDELFVLWAGGNDLIDIGGSLGDLFSGNGNPATVASNTAGHVQALANAGGRRFLVLNLPDLGAVPRYAGSSEAAAKSAAAVAHNTALSGELDTLGTSMNIDIELLDTTALFDLIIADPALYGFTNVTGPAYNESAGTVVSNPNNYAFWDEIHPTEAAHDWLAAAAYVALQAQGDFTGDGQVDDADLAVVLSGFGGAVTPFDLAAGDWTGDGRVDAQELELVLRGWTGASPPTVDVPEPGGVALCGVAVFVLLRQRR